MVFPRFRRKDAQDHPTLDVSRILKSANSALEANPVEKADSLFDEDVDAPSDALRDAMTDTDHSAAVDRAEIDNDAPRIPADVAKAMFANVTKDQPASVEAQLADVEAWDTDEASVSEAAPVEAKASPLRDGQGTIDTPIIEKLTPLLLWVSISLVIISAIFAIGTRAVDLTVALIFGLGVLMFIGLMIYGRATRAYSPLLLAGLLFKTPGRKNREAAVLAGEEIMSALGLAESIVSVDVDARLVTSRDGVVIYANDAYLKLAREAGVIGGTGLPPRLDRLFGQAGRESSKMFRLARAARSGEMADEIITQSMGQPSREGDIPRRRFEVTVRPMQDKGQHVAWRLREIPVESARDSLRMAYENYPRPVFALEKSGHLAWKNKAAAELIGVSIKADLSVEDFLLGETKDIIAALWDTEPEEAEGRLRARDGSGGNVGVVFTAFNRGGVGEGFVCVEMLPKTGVMAEKGSADLAADVHDAPFGVAVIEGDPGTDAKLVSVNRLFSEAFGTDVGDRLTETFPPNAIRDLVGVLRSRASTQPLTRAVEVTIGEGAAAHIFKLYARPIKRRRGAYGMRQTVLYAVDVSYQKRMEEDYAHDSRLKAIGKIAGSVAHDFNNFLQAMMGATELLMRRHPAGDPSYPDLVAIRENGQRARNLTSNLLAFSRKQTLQSEVLSVTDFLADFTPFVQRYVTEKVKVEVNHGRNLPHIKADKGQLELAIMNLSVNARDAMDKGGVLTISSKRVVADDVASYGYAVLDEIDHVLIEVSDNGTGVPDDIAEKIFEPFFTTKGEGKGTGLGLSTVHGIIGQMGGRIFLYNRPGEGATFRIFLPAVSEAEAAEAKPVSTGTKVVPEVTDLTGKGRILIVEDEDSVRSIVVRALSMCGYDIVEASDGDEALDIIDEEETGFDVVLSDIMMPEMDGPTLITEAGDKLKGAKVIFMSGYAEAAMRDKLQMIEGARYLQKPFTLKSVAATVKEAMGNA